MTNAHDLAIVHQRYTDADGFITQEGCLLAADDLTLIDADLADFLAERAQDMDRPVTIADVLATAKQFHAA